ncbi:MAG: plasmid stabilization system [Desulfovibrionaceae bacterium]|nr:MAG: plasmid stabilization system [Desulfovibrionaceae bacterium]
MMPGILARPQAQADLDDIWWYIAQDNPDSADRFLGEIEQRCNALLQFPRMGVSRDELMPLLRSLAVGNYIIFYLPVEDGIEIVRVLQGMREMEALF